MSSSSSISATQTKREGQLSEKASAYAVIFAGGTGSRMHGAQRPKQFLELGGRPIIAHTLQRFQDHPLVDGIAVACLERWIPELESVVARYGLDKVARVVPGGATGQDSIFNGLDALRGIAVLGDVVLIHDGVRPLVDEAAITRCIGSVLERGCTAVTARATETVVVGRDGVVDSIVDRSECLLARAPQGFRYGELLAAHERARVEGIHDSIDSISLMARYGHRIYSVEGPEENIKITTPRDFFAFKSFVDMEEVAQIWQP